MFKKRYEFKQLSIFTLIPALIAGLPAASLAKTYIVDCTKKGELQKTIDAAVDGDVIEINGICMENIVIAEKGLTLIGAAGPGPHGITGVLANTDGVRIENSRRTVLEGLTISNPHFSGIRILFHSDVVMRDCEVSNSFGGGGTGIWVQYQSFFSGLRLTLNNNLRGLGAAQQSRAFCYECDLHDNGWGATATQHALVTLLDSAVSGARGINAVENSYIDIDCQTHDSAHECSLNATAIAGQSVWESTVVFFGSGDFHGQLQAVDRAKVHLLGARQQSTGTVPGGDPRRNGITDESSLRVEPFFIGGTEVESSRLMGDTDVTQFARAMLLGDSTVLEGSIVCDEAGDAWVGPDVDLGAGASISGCDHAP